MGRPDQLTTKTKAQAGTRQTLSLQKPSSPTTSHTATMAAVAQQYYEEAAQNEQMGEEDEGVSKTLFCVRIIMMRDPTVAMRSCRSRLTEHSP